MAVTNYELIDTSTDVTTTRTLLHESIPLTGTIYSGTYGVFPTGSNIKNYTHGQFQSVYDYPYLSSSANHIFDVAIGYDESSALSGGTDVTTQQAKKINMYNEFSQVLLGYTSSTNQVRKFELDLTLDETGGTVMKEAVFINFSRLVTKDQIKKGTFSMTIGTASWGVPFTLTKTLTDSAASETGGTLNTLGGDYGLLYDDTDDKARGLIFYQAGIAVISTSSFGDLRSFLSYSGPSAPVDQSVTGAFISASISSSCDAIRHRIQNISFNNTTEINSTIYFCRVPHNKYNHSANPTYVTGSTIRVKSVNTDNPVAYITTIGLYNSSNELLAMAKLSEPLRKDPTNELTLRVRLDY